MAAKDLMTFERIAGAIEVGHGGGTKCLGEALDEALVKVAKAARAAGAKAKLALVLVAKPLGGNEMSLGAEIKTNCPEPGAFPIRVWMDKRGNLAAEDPEQGKLPLEAIKGGERE